jgi:NADPH-dependent glutamate synthase beta subunit-like oxidoreductase
VVLAWVWIRSHQRPGVWAAGNAANPRAQVITAAGEGSAAAIAINDDLVDEDLPIAVTNFRLGLPIV